MLTILSCSYMLDQSLAVVDPDDCAKGGLKVMPPVGMQGEEPSQGCVGAKPPLRPAEAGVLMHSV